MLDSTQLAQDASDAVPKVIVVGGLATFASELEIWLTICGIVYIVLQITFLCYRAWLMHHDRKGSKK